MESGRSLAALMDGDEAIGAKEQDVEFAEPVIEVRSQEERAAVVAAGLVGRLV